MEPSAEADQCGGGSVDGTDPVQQAAPAAQRPGAGQMPDRLLHQGAQAGLVAVVGAFSVGQPILGPPVPVGACQCWRVVVSPRKLRSTRATPA